MRNKQWIKGFINGFFAAIIGILIGMYFSSCNTNPYEKYNCPCKIIDRKITKYGKTVTITNRDSMEYHLLSTELYEKGIGYIIK